MNMEHWAQGVRRPSDGTLRALDLGADCTAGHWPGLCNQRKYGPEFADAPPAYPLERIRTPLALLSGARLPRAIMRIACLSWAGFARSSGAQQPYVYTEGNAYRCCQLCKAAEA